MGQSIKLLSTTTRVEAPFIEVNIGGYVFGKYTQKIYRYTSPVDGFTRRVIETFPDFVKSLNIQKINGQVNNYTLVLSYVIRPGDDPNKIDKILSSVSTSRKIWLSYGDCNSPTFIYKEEEAMITNVQQQVNIKSSIITYTITAVSSARLSMQGNFYFGGFTGKPSDEIKRVLKEPKYGLKDIFYGMRDDKLVEDLDLIADDDKEVLVNAQASMSPFDYIQYLVSCMTANQDSDNDIIGRHKYFTACFDDTTGILGGPYFKVQQVANNIQETTSLDTYEIDVGFPDADLITSLTINDNESYAILYNYQEEQNLHKYAYRVNDDGHIDAEFSPNILWDKTKFKATQKEKTWWAQMTQYPISVEITVKGLLRPSILMSYVKLNTLFYGRKHSSSGTYIITKQVDQIDANGYRSTLSLTRIKGDPVM